MPDELLKIEKSEFKLNLLEPTEIISILKEARVKIIPVDLHFDTAVQCYINNHDTAVFAIDQKSFSTKMALGMAVKLMSLRSDEYESFGITLDGKEYHCLRLWWD